MPSRYVRKSKHKYLSLEQKQQLVRLSKEEGWSDQKIGEHFGIQRQRVYEIRMRMGLGPLADEKMAKLVAEMEFLLNLDPTLTQNKIAELLEITGFRVNYMMAKTGWKMRGGRKDRTWVKKE